MKTVLFSDAHLQTGAAAREQNAEFCGFIERLGADGVRRVIVLGDLFDFWFEYRHVIFSGHFEALRAFAGLRDQGVELHLLCGNHDFWAGRFLRDELGFHIAQDTLRLDFVGRRALLFHGDGYNRRDWGYRIYKHVARARPVVRAFGLLHPDLAMGIAKRVSRTCRRMIDNKDPCKGSEAAALRDHARDVLGRGETDIVICGHAHAPAIEEYPTPSGPGLYINTGDWMKHRSYVEWDQGTFWLRYDTTG